MNSETSEVLLYRSDRFLDHKTGAHPECPARLEAIQQHFEQTDFLKKHPTVKAMPVNAEDLLPPEQRDRAILAVHADAYINRLQQFAAHGGGNWDADTVVGPESVDIAQLATSAMLHSVDLVMSGPNRRAVCLGRPPGHHAASHNAMGFCLLNHIAIAAQHAVDRHECRRVLIVDWDVHHGNGTQDIHYGNGEVWFFSVHRDPFYPGTGAADETGSGAGLGTTRNVPLPFGTSREDYLEAVEHSLTDFANRCQPELILISSGFDAHRLDPIGSLGLETEDFRILTNIACEIANQYCEGRIVSTLEGGYHPPALSESVVAHLEGLVQK